jgi:Peptidase family M23
MPTTNIDKGQVTQNTPGFDQRGQTVGVDLSQLKISENTNPAPQYSGSSSIGGNVSIGNGLGNRQITIDGKDVTNNIPNTAPAYGSSSSQAQNNIVPFNRNNDKSQLSSLNGADMQDLIREKVQPLDVSKIKVGGGNVSSDSPEYREYIKRLEEAYANSPETEESGGGGTPPPPPTITTNSSSDGGGDDWGFKKIYTMASMASGFSAFLVNLLLFLAALSIIMALAVGSGTVFLNYMCGAAEKVGPLESFLPQQVKDVCTLYSKLKGGCLNQPVSTDSTAPKDSGLQSLGCLGDTITDNEDNILMFGLSGKVKAKKSYINEIIKAGAKANLSTNDTKLVIAMFPLITPTNAWKENINGGCYGIAQFCDSNSTTLNNNSYKDATDGLNVGSVADYQKSPELQMKSIKQLIDKREESFRNSPPKCITEAVRNKSDVYRKMFLFNKFECDGESTFVGTSKKDFADRVEKNYEGLDCKLFQSYYNSTKDSASNGIFQDYSYNNPTENEIAKTKVDLVKGLAFASQAQFNNISKEECQEAKKYKDVMEEASKKYANNLFPLSVPLLSGILGKETNFALLIGGCDQYGDGGFGHGIGQSDGGNVGAGLTGPRSSRDIKVAVRTNSNADTLEPKINKGYPTEEKYKWSDCTEGIKLAAAHLIEIQHFAHDYIIKSLKEGGMNVTADDKGFNDPNTRKAYIQGVLISNNAGPGGLAKESCAFDKNKKLFFEGCTAVGPSGKGDYGTDVIRRALDFAKCLGFESNEKAIFTADSKSDGSGTNLECSQATDLGGGSAGDGEFPLVTKAGSNVAIRFTAGFPVYPSGGGHNGTDWGPEPNLASTNRVISITDGKIVSDYSVLSRSNSGGRDDYKNQRAIKVQAPDGRAYSYVHLDLDKNTYFKKQGDTVKKGDIIGQLDQSPVFTHLHFSVFVNGVAVQPLDHLKGLPKGFAPNPIIAIQENRVPKPLHEKLP